MSEKVKILKMGNVEHYDKLYKEEAKQLATIGYAKRFKVLLGRPIKDFKGSDLHRIINEAFEGNLDENMTLDEARMMMLGKQMFKMGSTGLKAIELSYRIDGTFDNKETNIDLDEIESRTEGIE